MKAVYKRRLLKLRTLLLADARRKKGIKFDLGSWAKPADRTLPFTRSDPVPLDCGTKACAVGLACISGAFKRSGLTYKILGHGIDPIYRPRDGLVRHSWGAVEEFFGLEREGAAYLFSPDSYDTKAGA